MLMALDHNGPSAGAYSLSSYLRLDPVEKVVKNTAKRTGALVVATNLVGEITKGPWKGQVYGGQSITVEQNGRTITIARDRDRDIKIVAVKARIQIKKQM